jgi:FdrA protein
MVIATKIIGSTYRDSVSLMQLAAAVGRLPGVDQASANMATPGNLDLLREVGLIDGDIVAEPTDLLIVVRADTKASAVAALAHAEHAVESAAPGSTGAGDGPEAMAPRSLAMAHEATPQANLALISVPGEYAAAEARKALELGLNVMLFSDNVALADEVALKRLANERALLLMGPDCGTSIIGGVPLGFANRVRRGAIGCIGASGTGLQQVSVLVDRLGLGVSQVIGTGGRDLSTEVGGLTMLRALAALAADPATKVIVLVSKPPAAEVSRSVLAAASKVRKPVVIDFLGADIGELRATMRAKNLHPVRTLEDGARMAVALAKGQAPPRASPPVRLKGVPRLAAAQRYVRGLYSGGTFCYEAALILGEALGKVWSNTPLHAEDALADPWHSRAHTLVDLGDDVFTRGRPHPMIDHRFRNERIMREAQDAEVAVILFDVVLGFGSHPDPAAEMIPALRAARAAAGRRRQRIAFVAYVCGTPGDPQGLTQQEAALDGEGVMLAGSNAGAARMAAAIAGRRHGEKGGR